MTYQPIPQQTTMPNMDVSAVPVRQAPQKVIATSYAAAGAGVNSSEETLISTGAGMTVNRTGGNLVITAGTTVNSETVIRSVGTMNGRLTFTVGDTLSQRIANNNFYREIVDVIGDGLSYNIVSAVILDVTKTAHGFTAENIGQRMDWCALSSVGVPQEVVIASIPDADTIRFTTVGNPASGSGTCSLTGWNKIEINYTGTTAANFVINSRRRGYQNTATVVAGSSATAGASIMTTIQNDRVLFSTGTIAVGTAFTDRSMIITNIPEPDTVMYYQIRAKNGTVAPASSTTWTCAFTRVQDFISTQVELTGIRQSGSGVTVPVSGSLTTVSTVSSITSAQLAIPGLLADVASAAITTTTTTATLTPSFGVTYTVNIPVTAVTGTNPTLDVVVQESDDTGTNWFDVYHFERITATGSYRSPPLTLRGNRVRYVQTVGGTTPSFTRAINRLQRSDDASQRVRFINRTIVPNTLNSTTATYYIEGATSLNVMVRCTAHTTAATIALQLSADSVNWYNDTTTITTALGIVYAAYTNEQWKFARLIVTAAGTGITLGEVVITGVSG